jgi:parallel beta-helix repeat protein
MRSTATIAALILAGALAFAGPAAAKGGGDGGDRGGGHDDGHATTVYCGQILRQSVKLANDLADCPMDGLVIGAAGITVDLNGHTIDGTVTQLTECNAPPFGVAGISNGGGYDGLTIKNGTLQQFSHGFSAGSGTTGLANSRLHDLTARDNRFSGISMGSGQRLNNDNRIVRNHVYGNGCGDGIGLNNAHGNLVAHNRAHDNGTGIGVCCSDNNVIENNVVLDNSGRGIGIVFGSDSHNVIRHNRVSGNGNSGISVGRQEGDQRNVVESNMVSGNGGAGIILDDANANRISLNRLVGNGDDIVVFGNDNTIAGNHVADAVGCPDGGCGVGISLEGGERNLLTHNAVARTLRDGIRVAAFDPAVPTVDNVVRENLVRDAGVDGLSVGTEGEGTVTGTLLEGNLALRSGDDGIDVKSELTTLSRNLALRNTDFGIEAVPGVTDGGGNRARGNGNPEAQCIGVACH